MSTPHRVQQRRTRGWRKPENTVSVARPSQWGNPWRVERVDCYMGGMCWGTTVPNFLGDRVIHHEHRESQRDAAEAAVTAFRHAILYPLSSDPAVPDLGDIRCDLRGKNLMCFCPLDQPCHADVLLELANGDPT